MANLNDALATLLATLFVAALPLRAPGAGPAIAVGGNHACAITPGGKVRCWGGNFAGQLGDGTTTDRLAATEVAGLPEGAIAIATGGAHTCAVTPGGAVKCWGLNASGQVGDGTTTSRSAPVPVSGLASGVVSVAAGDAHTCALTEGGDLRCWGSNASGQVGDGTGANALVPVAVAGLANQQVVAAAEDTTCGLSRDGRISCWGYAGLQEANCRVVGQICIPDWFGNVQCVDMTQCDYVPRNRPVATRIAGEDSGFTTLAVGDTTTGVKACGATRGGSLACANIERPVSVTIQDAVPGPTAAVTLGADVTCALDASGRVRCWGWNLFGQVGDGSGIYQGAPVALEALPGNIVGLGASVFSACAIAADGAAYCWGCNAGGQLGDGTYRSRKSPVTVAGLDASALAGGVTGLWWNPDESGWGMNVNQQGDVVFATLYVYGEDRKPAWFVMSGGARTPGTSTFGGALYRVSASPFDANPFAPLAPRDLRRVGTMSIAFTSSRTARLDYDVDGVAVTKSVAKQVFGSRPAYCEARAGSRRALENYQDLWWTPAEPGWGLGIAHQDDTLFATLYVNDANRRDVWLVMPQGKLQSRGKYAGDLYRTAGPPFAARPFTPIGGADIARVGTMRLEFTDGQTGTLAYSVDGVAVTKAITRQVFASPAPACN